MMSAPSYSFLHLLSWLTLSTRFTVVVASSRSFLDVSRLSRIVCPKDATCRIVQGQVGSMESTGKGSFDENTRTHVSGGQDDFWELSSCYKFDCIVDCDSSCSCHMLATQQICQQVEDPNLQSEPEEDVVAEFDADVPSPPEVSHEPQLFRNLQDVRFSCSLPRTRCEISGFEECGGSMPEYNLYNSDTGLFVVDDPSRDDHTIEVYGCNAKLGSARCDAGCTCRDLATNAPCDATPAPSPPPETQPLSNRTVIFTPSRKEAKITCQSLQARCDLPLDSPSDLQVCGASWENEPVITVGIGSIRVDRSGDDSEGLFHQHPEWYTVTFAACYERFAMECDSRCTCVNSRTGRPCACIASVTGEDCTATMSRASLWNLFVVVAASFGLLLVLRQTGCWPQYTRNK